MSEKYIIETIGTIIKKETLTTIGYSDLVLESQYPFPGYHGTTVPDEDNPKSAFLITKSDYGEEKIIRATQNIKKKYDIKFDASPGLVNVLNEMRECIRIKGVGSYDDVPRIIQLFKDEGFSFAGKKNIEPYRGLIRVIKYFLLEPINHCTLQDNEIPAMRYFQIPFPLEWEVFENLTIEIKRNMEDPNFDAALAIIYRKAGITDYIRIYDAKCSDEKLNLIRKKYIQGMKKLIPW